MNDAARRLRAQMAYSIDPAYLERMAREEEIRRVDPTNDVAAEGGQVGIGLSSVVRYPTAIVRCRRS